MECSVVQDSLIEYHFATLAAEARDGVDAHLLGCPACLRSYLQLKRQMDVGPPGGGSLGSAERGGRSMAEPPLNDEERPSAAARARLRAAVVDAFVPRPSLAGRVARAFARPIPLYQGVVAVALGILLVSVLTPLVRGEAPSWLSHPGVLGAPAGPRIDTSRPPVADVDIY